MPVSERHEAIRRLFATRYDNLPESSRRSHAESGFVDGWAWVSCPDCLANDKRMNGCETCGGQGRLKEFREHDPYAINEVRRYGITGAHHDQRVARDAAISRAEQGLKRFPGFRPQSTADELESANRTPYAWERAREAMYRTFDYAALDLALEMLRETLPDVNPMSPRGLDFIDPWMPADIRAPKPAPPPEQPLPRNTQIRLWDREGRSRAWIQAQTGLGERQVREIINGTKTEAA